MKAKRAVRRARAERDIDAAAEHYFAEGGTPLELRFVAALEAAIRHVATHPATGSARYAVELGVPGLRFWKLKRFPYLIFYVERVDHIDVWRVLHDARDLPAWLQESDEGP
ncbi:MAG TPA: type II toxin-antitoxin system RelE/ParE family toxin [Burkholderiaceae bacterium]|jgi:toxin ParE1/3/4